MKGIGEIWGVWRHRLGAIHVEQLGDAMQRNMDLARDWREGYALMATAPTMEVAMEAKRIVSGRIKDALKEKKQAMDEDQKAMLEEVFAKFEWDAAFNEKQAREYRKISTDSQEEREFNDERSKKCELRAATIRYVIGLCRTKAEG